MSIAPVQGWMKKVNPMIGSLLTGLSAFFVYSCVYSFRKTFAAATFNDLVFAGIDYKVWLVSLQVIGYAASKFAGIKVIAELESHGRARGILITTGIAAGCWIAFAMTPAPFNIGFMFVNGFVLGLVWGMVFGYLEGREHTDLLGSMLAVSFVFSSGFCKSVGSYAMQYWHISEFWMPAISGLLFMPPLLLFLWLLDQTPPPSAKDEQLRHKRVPMNGTARINFIITFLPGLILLIAFYALLTAFRDFRDNFSADIWQSLGITGSPEIFMRTEVPTSLSCLIVIGGLVFIRRNAWAFTAIYLVIITGMVVLGVATYCFQRNFIAAEMWMTLTGLGLYLSYIPFNSSFFDRLLATFRVSGTVGFVMYLADSVGYLGSLGVLLYKQFGQKDLSWLQFFLRGSYALAILGSALLLGSAIYFRSKFRRMGVTDPP